MPNLSGVGQSAAFASPPPIGSVAQNTGNFTTLNSTTSQANAIVTTPLAVTYAASLTLNMANYSSFGITLTGNLTLANPTSLIVGNVGQIVLTQDATGNRVLTTGTYFVFPGGTRPVLSTAANAVDILFFTVLSATKIACSIQYGVA